MKPKVSGHVTREHLESLQAIALQLIESTDDRQLLFLILDKAANLLCCDAGSLYLKTDNGSLVFEAAINRSINLNFQSRVIAPSKHGIANYVFQSGTSVMVSDAHQIPEGSPYHFDASFDRISRYRTRSVLAVPLTSSQGDRLGVIQLLNRKQANTQQWPSDDENALRKMPDFSEEDQALLLAFAALASASIEKANLYESIENLFKGFIRASVRVIEDRDPATRGHSERVAILTVDLARKVNASPEKRFREARLCDRQLQELYYAALLHDFGKVTVREATLLKKDKLSAEQFLRIRGRLEHFANTAEVALLRSALQRITREKKTISEWELANLEKEIRNRREEVERFWDIIKEANRPTVLKEDVSKKVQELQDRKIALSDGTLSPVLESEEAMTLSINRGSLTQEERQEIENHVTSTYLFLREIPWTKGLTEIPDIAYCHHEKLDGSGYPRRLSGEQIPIQSRIMTICDIFDALTAADRPYKKSLSTEQALRILEDEAKEGKLDSVLLKIFIEGKVYTHPDFVNLNQFKKAA